MSIGFPARYTGRCGNCDEVFIEGAEVFYAPPDDVLMGVECCGEVAAIDSRSTVSEVTPADKVMPRGKSARDRCDQCFQVPASNGVCGCS